MGKLSAGVLAQHLVDALGVLRNKSDLQASVGLASALLLIKRASDQPGLLNVPQEESWPFMLFKSPARGLEYSLRALELANPKVLGQVSSLLDVLKGLTDADIWSLVDRFSRISLRDADLELEDTVGRGFAAFIDRIADSAGKRSYEFSTPAPLADLMIRLADPGAGQSVYDPFAGIGGLLVGALRHVQENSKGDSWLSLWGQEVNAETAAIAEMNLALNAARVSDVQRGDSLAEPLQVTKDGMLLHFDRVLAHAPFSMDYERRSITHPERMAYGWTTGHGKADLMVVQHVLSALTAAGRGVVLVPAGLLFRGGVEADIRRGIVEDGRIDTVISLGANAVPGISIPACILVLRGTDGWRREDRKDICFISAARELSSGRSRRQLSPETSEKIVSVFLDRASVPSFSHVASLDEIAGNHYDLNVHRYVAGEASSAPPLDSEAIIYGGIPRREAEFSSAQFRRFGIDLADLLAERSERYLDFPEGECRSAEERMGELAAARERECADAVRTWWASHTLSGQQYGAVNEDLWLLTERPRLLASFRTALQPIGLLDKYQLSAVFAGWWFVWHSDLRILDRSGFLGVIQGWTSESVDSRMKEAQAREQVLERLGDDLLARTEAAVTDARQRLVDIYQSWTDRYAVSLSSLEDQAKDADAHLKDRLRQFRHVAD
jgi:type I restriction enzyme M protein